MRLEKVILENYRGFKMATTINIESDITAILGKNDAGKSSILDALNVFFNGGIEKDDACVTGDSSNVKISCVFSDLPETIIIDTTNNTQLTQEYLLNADGFLEIEKLYDCTLAKPKEKGIFAVAMHPATENYNDLLSLKIADLKKRASNLNVDLQNVNQTISANIRSAIWASAEQHLEETRISLTKEDGKRIYDALSKKFPYYALFKSDRPSTDQDAEAQDPMKVAIKEVTERLEESFAQIKNEVEHELTQIAELTVKKAQELSPEIARILTPKVNTKKLDSLFSVSLSGDNDIPINKRGSGIRRLLLLSFFRAEAERKLSEPQNSDRGIIYAIEEPETSQHPHNQKLLLEAFADLAENPSNQILLTTHTPALAQTLDEKKLRYVKKDNENPSVVCIESDEIRAEVTSSLGILPDNKVKLFIGVEGCNDIEFLKAVSKNYAAIDSVSYPDLDEAEKSGEIVFIPVGGSNLKLWISRLNGLTRPQIYFMDRDNEPPQPAKYQAEYDSLVREGHTAYITQRKELENYIALSILQKTCPNYSGTGATFENVPTLFAKAIHEASGSSHTWEEILGDKEKFDKKESQAKKRLNRDLAMRMNTIDLLRENDPNCELSNWLIAIKTALESS